MTRTANICTHAIAHLCYLRAQTCNFDTLYAYLSTANYDFNVKTLNSNHTRTYAVEHLP